MLSIVDSTIAVIDSGIGGISVLKRLIDKFEYGNYIYYADNLYMPYGNKSKKFLKDRLENIINILINQYNVSKIIIACNTASSILSKNSNSNIITLDFDKTGTYFTTNLTKKNIKNNKTIADKNLAELIEKNIYNKRKIETIVKRHVAIHHIQDEKNLILGCTHYELIKNVIKNFCPNTNIELNSDSIMNKIQYIPKIKNLNIKIILSKASIEYENKILRLLEE